MWIDAIIEYLRRVATYNPLIVIIELLLIGLVVYWAVNFLEGTRGERLFRGVIILLLAGSMILKLLVTSFGFERLQYLYSSFLILVLILAVAGFQPEIRRMLIRIGETGTNFRSSSQRQLSQTVEEMITAVNNLSEKKIGAIIVIERQVALGEFTETGVRIDAQVKSALLESIFYPGGALHDLAVIIHGDKIAAARVQLPLAELGTVKGVLGSRHRAAIGITTGSDAFAIVVSEETGIVSIAEEGKLDRHITEEELRKRLTNIIVDTAGFAARFKRNKEEKQNQAHQELS
ncbi:MAG: diadenylate cyclase CdaA [Phycisphaerales bacterium]